MKKRNFTQLLLVFVSFLGIYGVAQAQSPNPPETLLDPPAHDASDVLAIYSEAYTADPVVGFTFNGTDVEEKTILDNKMWYTQIGTGTNPCFLEFTNPLNLSEYNTFFMDVYAVEQNTFSFKIRIDGNANWQLVQSVKTGWNRLEFDLNDFMLLTSRPDLSNVNKINLVGEGTRNIYVDNIYACKVPHSEMAIIPTVAAPIPSQQTSDVLPIFTDIYPDEIGGTLDKNTVGNPAKIKGLIYSEGIVDKMIFVKNGKTGNGGLNFNTVVDITEYDSLHFDVYPINATFPMRIIIAGVANQGTMVTAGVQNAWNPIDISIEDFLSKVTTAPDITNIKDRGFWLFQATGYERTFFLDNVFFYKTRSNEPGPGVGLSEISSSDLVKIYPSGNNIQVKSEIEMNAVQVYTLSGKNIRTIQQAGTNISIDLENELSGVYIFKINLEDGSTITKKIMKM